MLAQRAPGGPKPAPVAAVTQSKDWHTAMGSLLLKAEKTTNSLERMLAVCRAILAFLTTALRPGSRFSDVPCVMLGQHYLSHRELGEQHRGDFTRAYLQELCAHDPRDEPIRPAKYAAEGHADVARWGVHVTPASRARVRKDGLLGTAGAAFLEVSLEGAGWVEFPRHAERYAFTLPALVLGDPQAQECPLDFDGVTSVSCLATGLTAEMRFKGWRAHRVKGEVSRLNGEGRQKVARIEGHWDGQVTAVGVESDASGVMFDAADYSPPLPYPLAMNLAKPGPRASPRFWSSVLEAVLYTDGGAAAGAGKKAEALAAALPGMLRASLMFEVPEGPKNSRPHIDDAEALAAAKDSRPLPPVVRVQRALGRPLQYHLRYLVQALSQAALEAEADMQPRGAAAP